MNAAFLIGRILFVALFFTSGLFSHLLNMRGAVAYAKAAGAPLPELMVPLTGVVLVVASVMIAVGYHPRLAAWALFLFLLPTTFIMHRFWGLTDAQMATMQQIQFMKNLSLMGATLMIQLIDKWPLSLRP
jgi:putative oxidoreductase